jgi:hypothetical protein
MTTLIQPRFWLFVSTVLMAAAAMRAEADQTTATKPCVDTSSAALAASKTRAIDWRHSIESKQWHRTAQGTWVTPTVKAEFPFNELIYSWKTRVPRDEGWRLYLQAEFGAEDRTPWLYAGYWGDVKITSGSRTNPKFDRGIVDQDTLQIKQKAVRYQFKLVSEGEKPLSVLPSLFVITTDTSPTEEMSRQFTPSHPDLSTKSEILDVPYRAQEDMGGNRLIDRCQSAAVAAAMSYFGKDVPLENIICYTTDPEYKAFGIWPRTINTAVEHGFDAYIDRFRDWNQVRKTVSENKVILCSITMPKNDCYIAPPYPDIGGHIVALKGVTPDGRVLVVDSAKTAGDQGGCLQWLAADFEKIWMRNKGGVGMVICPPKGAQKKLLREVPPFPRPIPGK